MRGRRAPNKSDISKFIKIELLEGSFNKGENNGKRSRNKYKKFNENLTYSIRSNIFYLFCTRPIY